MISTFFIVIFHRPPPFRQGAHLRRPKQDTALKEHCFQPLLFLWKSGTAAGWSTCSRCIWRAICLAIR